MNKSCRNGIIGISIFLMLTYLGFYYSFAVMEKRSFRNLIFVFNKPAFHRHINASIWPRDLNNETDDRISEQIGFMHSLNASGNFSISILKVIFQVPHSNYGGPLPDGQNVFTSCPIQACSITSKEGDLRTADAVFFQTFQSSMMKKFMPKPSYQVWIVNGGESPPLTSHMNLFDARAFANLVNWTMLYRRDSTISTPYGKFQTFPNFTRIEDYPLGSGVDYAAGKTKKVAWFVSNCNFGTYSGRMNYVKELAKHIQVDIYGACGQLKCPKNEMKGCLQTLRKDYKFYLAFENNCCKDYVTEKFFHNALQNNVLPIVLGASPEDYKSLAPPRSFIHVDDYDSPKDLADYLHLLDGNDTLYNDYFRWKRTGDFVPTSGWCRLCALLHASEGGSYVHWYPDFYKWWEEDVCLERPPQGKWQSWRKKN